MQWRNDMVTTRTTPAVKASRTPLVRSAIVGAIAGVGASMVMAAYAMIASATQGHGFFTPLYHIASLFISPSHLMMSMQDAMGGKTYDFFVGPALLGAVIHMMTGLMFGAIFAVVASMARLRGVMLIGAGVVWGILVFVISSVAALPIAGALFHSGDQITHMAKMAGYGTFFIEHVLFGMALGLLLTPRRLSAGTAN
jgi:hypothetical protein